VALIIEWLASEADKKRKQIWPFVEPLNTSAQNDKKIVGLNKAIKPFDSSS
jgi:hypothetical protein